MRWVAIILNAVIHICHRKCYIWPQANYYMLKMIACLTKNIGE